MFGIVITLLLFATAGHLYFIERFRSARDVAFDLLSNGEESKRDDHPSKSLKVRSGLKKSAPLLLMVLFASFLGILINLRIGAMNAFVVSMIIVSVIYIAIKRAQAITQYKAAKEIDFYVPVIMERLVMAVESGLDVLSAIRAIVSLDYDMKKKPSDPVTRLLARVVNLTDEGMKFDEAIELVGSSVENSSVRHAFVHLAVACREGGELVNPLRELSDASQSMYQDSIEEEIAKMPVKATLPLIITFAGLIVVFITAPLVQVVNFVDKASLSKETNR